MKKGVLFGLAALAVGVVVLTLGKKDKPSNYSRPYVNKWLKSKKFKHVVSFCAKLNLADRTLLPL